jgi:hypothetical protein
MTITITLTPDLEEALAAHANQQGTTPEMLALDALRERFLSATPETPSEAEGTLADFLAGFIGTLHSSERVPGGAGMSENTGSKFAAGLARKRKAGKL